VRKTVAVLAAALLGGTVPATARAADPDTTALRDAVTRAEILRYEQRLQAIGLANENNRLTASTGNFESVDFVINELRKMGYNPSLVPYANANNPNSWSERTATLERTDVTPARSYKNLLGVDPDVNDPAAQLTFAQMQWSHTADITAQVIPVNRIVVPPTGAMDSNSSGCAMSDFPAAVKDNIALIQRGGCSYLEKVINAQHNGAIGVFVFNEGNVGDRDRNTAGTPGRIVAQTYPGLPAASLSYALGKEFYDAAQAGTPATVHFKSDNNLTQRIDYDVLAETPGGDPNRVLQVGAHIDGVAAGPGINDDGSGTAMNLAIAHQILELGIPLKYKIRFGWFSGEEQGLRGSTFLVNQLNTLQTAQTLAMLDYDMIASTNWIPFVYTDGNTGDPPTAESILGRSHINYLKDNLNIDSTFYIFDNRSDYAQWRVRGVPATGLYTGAETLKTPEHVAMYGGQVGIQADPCYHEWCDTVFNLSEFGMNEFSDSLAHTILSFAGVGNDAVELPIREES
jgi:Zn-dependent M28 family amino/carboxypeptidase